MSTSPETPATEPAQHEPNAADAQALAQAGAQAAAQADPGTSPAAIKRMVREAIKEEADERNLKGFGEAEAGMIATAVVSSLEARGAFNEPPQVDTPAPANPAEPGQQQQAAQQPATPDDAPRKKTFAEKMLRG